MSGITDVYVLHEMFGIPYDVLFGYSIIGGILILALGLCIAAFLIKNTYGLK